MFYIVVTLFVISLMIYGLVNLKRNKRINRWEKIFWLIFILVFPVLGASIYLRTYFNPGDRF